MEGQTDRVQINCCLVFLNGFRYLFLISMFLFCYVGCPILIYYGAYGEVNKELFYNAIAITISAYLLPIVYCCIANCKTRTITCGNYEIVIF